MKDVNEYSDGPGSHVVVVVVVVVVEFTSPIVVVDKVSKMNSNRLQGQLLVSARCIMVIMVVVCPPESQRGMHGVSILKNFLQSSCCQAFDFVVSGGKYKLLAALVLQRCPRAKVANEDDQFEF